jgi:ribosome biogenesis GTPase A
MKTNLNMHVRSTFCFPKSYKINWFPGHMVKTYRSMPEQLKKADLFLEIRDSRIPQTSGNDELNKIIPPHIKRIIIFNKFDLCNQKLTKKIVENYTKQNKNIKCIFASAKTTQNVQKILDLIIRENNPKFKTVGTWCMIGGIPNVGKSTIINTFRTMSRDLKELSEQTVKYAQTGKTAATTRNMDCFKINLDPIIFIIDTPGVMSPEIKSNEQGIKLSVCGNIKDKIAGKEMICDYLLWFMNKNKDFDYVKALRLENPSDSIHEVVQVVGEKFKIYNTSNIHDFIFKCFKEGKFGKFTFDDYVTNDVISQK